MPVLSTTYILISTYGIPLSTSFLIFTIRRMIITIRLNRIQYQAALITYGNILPFQDFSFHLGMLKWEDRRMQIQEIGENTSTISFVLDQQLKCQDWKFSKSWTGTLINTSQVIIFHLWLNLNLTFDSIICLLFMKTKLFFSKIIIIKK